MKRVRFYPNLCAPEAVLRMLEEIGSLDRIPWAVARAKDKKE